MIDEVNVSISVKGIQLAIEISCKIFNVDIAFPTYVDVILIEVGRKQ
jgi:hypothetical protein